MKNLLGLGVRKLAASLTAAALSVVLAGCGETAANYDVSAIGPKIHVGVATDEPGLGFVQSGQYTGLDVEVARYIVHELGFVPSEIVWHSVEPSNRESMLTDGTVDMIVGSYSITAERQSQVDFAGPYFEAGQDLLVRKAGKHINRVEDLGSERVCTAQGSTSASVIRQHDPQVQVDERERIAVCITALLSGQADAVSADDIALSGLSKVSGGGQLAVVGAPFSVEKYGVAVRHGQPTLVAQINDALEAMIKDGSWERAVKDAARSIDFKLSPSQLRPPALDGSLSQAQR
ncbi:transporter substrate-binding domain-containing protein [Bombiscardovia apis]|nr:transporter substrate-binding domain-containing protein [Bombiscardovia apis]